MNLVKKLVYNLDKRPKKTAVKYYKNGHLYSLNWEQCFDRVDQCYKALANLGTQAGDKVGIYSDTCKEWGFIDLANMALRATTVPLYHSSHKEDIEFIFEDSKPKIVFVQNENLYNKLKKTSYFNSIEKIIAIDNFETDDINIIFYKELISRGENPITNLREAANIIEVTDLATIIYTSGTSGIPKGVKLTHEQIESCLSEVFPLLGVTSKDSTLTFLPFSHILGRLELWGHYFSGYCIGYAQSIDKIKVNLLEVKPTVIVGVPRIFEKIYFGIKAQVEISKLKQSILKTAIKIGQTSTQLQQEKKSPSLLHAIKSQLANQLVFSHIKEKFGGNLRFAVSGGAPLDPGIADLFSACGINILEGYGLTETTGCIFINTLFEHRNGTVGKAIGDVQIRFDSDKEILIKSKKVMTGYYNDDEATQKAFTEDGYFRTGDIGELTPDGFLKITDRKKDLIKTAGGKFVAPQKLQNLFATEPLIGHIHIHGDKEKYIVALVTLEKSEIMKWKKEEGIQIKDYKTLVQSPVLLAQVRKSIANINEKLASFETIKRYKVLDHEFTIEDGHLTPSLKMKRKKIDELYKNDIEQLYQ